MKKKLKKKNYNEKKRSYEEDDYDRDINRDKDAYYDDSYDDYNERDYE